MLFFAQSSRISGSLRSLVLLLAAAALPSAVSAASLNIYLSRPGDQSTYIAGATTETFNSMTAGIQSTPYASAIGTYQFSPSSHFAALAADQFGGANGSQYVSLGAQSHSSTPVTLQLNQPATYFGFWWSAGDANNGVSFYYNSTLLSRLSTADIANLLSANGGTVTAVNGMPYSKSSYYGNPNNHLDTSQPFAYVDVFAQNTGFNKIVFDNSGTTASGFESDNHSAYLGAAQPNGASVFVENVPAVAVSLSPEPVTALGGLAALCVAFLLRRRKEQ